MLDLQKSESGSVSYSFNKWPRNIDNRVTLGRCLCPPNPEDLGFACGGAFAHSPRPPLCLIKFWDEEIISDRVACDVDVSLRLPCAFSSSPTIILPMTEFWATIFSVNAFSFASSSSKVRPICSYSFSCLWAFWMPSWRFAVWRAFKPRHRVKSLKSFVGSGAKAASNLASN